MSAQNLAVCFAPSLFQLCPRLAAVSPTRRHKTVGGALSAAGLPNEKELRENQAAQSCLTQMIVDCKRLFIVPASMREQYGQPMIDVCYLDATALSELGKPNGNYRSYLRDCIRTLLRVGRRLFYSIVPMHLHSIGNSSIHSFLGTPGEMERLGNGRALRWSGSIDKEAAR